MGMFGTRAIVGHCYLKLFVMSQIYCQRVSWYTIEHPILIMRLYYSLPQKCESNVHFAKSD